MAALEYIQLSHAARTYGKVRRSVLCVWIFNDVEGTDIIFNIFNTRYIGPSTVTFDLSLKAHILTCFLVRLL